MAGARQERMSAGRRAFARGDFFAAHEEWEAAWNASVGDERRWIQGMIQVATALHKLAAARADLAQSLLGKALAKLSDAPPSLDGIALARFAHDAAQLLGALRRRESPPTIVIHDEK